MNNDKDSNGAGGRSAETRLLSGGLEAGAHKKCNGTGRYPKREGRWILFKYCRRCNGTGRLPMKQTQPHNATSAAAIFENPTE